MCVIHIFYIYTHHAPYGAGGQVHHRSRDGLRLPGCWGSQPVFLFFSTVETHGFLPRFLHVSKANKMGIEKCILYES